MVAIIFFQNVNQFTVHDFNTNPSKKIKLYYSPKMQQEDSPSSIKKFHIKSHKILRLHTVEK